MPVLGFGNQDAGDKGAERQRQAGTFGQMRQAERDQQHVEHEQFGRLATRHDVEPPVHQPLAEEQHYREHQHGLEHRQADHRRHLLG